MAGWIKKALEAGVGEAALFDPGASANETASGQSVAQKWQRMHYLHFKASQGTLTPPERNEMDALNRWAQALYGYGRQPVVDTAAPDAAGGGPARVSAAVDGPGAYDPDNSYDDPLGDMRSYDSFGDWMSDMRTAQGRSQLGTLSMLSPTATLIGLAREGVDYDPSKGYDPALGNTQWGFDIEYANNQFNPRGAVTDPKTGLPIDYTMIGHEYGTGISDADVAAAAADDAAANAAAAAAMEAEHGIGLDAFGGTGDDGDSSDDASGHDTDPGGDFRRGGYIPGDSDGVLEPREIEAHETEYVIRPEAVEAIGLPALDRLNRMGARPGDARASAGRANGLAPGGLTRDRAAMPGRPEIEPPGPPAGDILAAAFPANTGRPPSGIPALDALARMPRKRHRGLYHDRTLGRVMQGGA